PEASHIPIPSVKIMRRGSSSETSSGFDPFRKSTIVLLRKFLFPPSPGRNAREIPFWFVHWLGPFAMGTQRLSSLLSNTPPATALLTYVCAMVRSTFDIRMAILSISEYANLFHLPTSP